MIQPGNVPPRVQEDTQEDDFAREAAEAEQERSFTEFLEAGAEFDPRLEALAEQLGAGGAEAFAAGGDFGGLGALFGSDTDTGDEQEQGVGGFGQGVALASELGGGLADGIQAVTGPAEGIQGGIIGGGGNYGGGNGGRGGYGE